jgi:3-hydroxyacyl-[acyl-carrier-protein] dehydratase
MDGMTQNDSADFAHSDEPAVVASEVPAASAAALADAPSSDPGGLKLTARIGDRFEQIDVMRIMEAIPHRYPFLMIDRMVDVVLDRSAVGIKNVSVNEPHFQGHFPATPVMPGVLIIEAMAQTAAALVVFTLGTAFEGKLVYFMTIDNAKFRRPVVPGDQLRIHVDKERNRGNVWKFRGVARVDGVAVAEATFSAMIMR